MINSIKKYMEKTAATVLVIALLAGCSGMLENPLKDKESGEDINLLLLDFNFFTTRMTFKLLDAKDSSAITLPAVVSFSGNNGNDIVTFAGDKKPTHSTTQGQLELTIDPNVDISESSPFEFAISAEVNGYNPLLKGIRFTSEGKKTIELYLVKPSYGDQTDLEGDIEIIDGDTSIVFSVLPSALKSATVEEKPYKINYSITINDILKFKDAGGNFLFSSSAEVMEAYNSDPNNFVTLSVNMITDYAPGIDVIDDSGELKSVLFRKLETGKLTKITITGKQVASLNGGVITSTCTYLEDDVPDVFGFAEFNISKGAWDIIGNSTVYESTAFEYTLVKASLESLCATGSSITFSSPGISSFSIDADVYDGDGTQINTINFKGNFPETFVVENAPSEAVTLVFRNNNPSFAAIPNLEIDNFCSGSYNITITPTTGYDEYQIVLKAICPDNPTVAIAPTYSAEIKIKGSDDPWQGVDMTGGIVDLLGKSGQEYELRLLWEDEFEYSTYSTYFNEADGSYTGGAYPKTKIVSGYIEDGRRIRVNVEKQFNQNVCDDLGW
jgi:hypothetical protein